MKTKCYCTFVKYPMTYSRLYRLTGFSSSRLGLCAVQASAADKVDLILHNGKIVSVDAAFSIQQAMAVAGDRIQKLGKNDEFSHCAATTRR